MATNYTQRKYEQSDTVKQAQDSLTALNAQKPAAYQSQYKPQIDDMVGQILNRKDFQYDLNGDAMYQQYKDRYVNLGQQAMMDTMGQASKLTGGYGNSYAQLAGQQAYQGYLQGLNDRVPELYQLALDRYNQQGQDLYNRYGLLSSQEEQAYNRYLSDYNLWNTERDWLAGRYDTERGYDYGAHRDAVADAQWQAGFDEDVRRFNFANKLGEFAPTAVPSTGGGGGSGGGGGGPKPITPIENSIMELIRDSYHDYFHPQVDYSGWNEAQWKQYFATIASNEGSTAARAEQEKLYSSGALPAKYMSAASSAASGKWLAD